MWNMLHSKMSSYSEVWWNLPGDQRWCTSSPQHVFTDDASHTSLARMAWRHPLMKQICLDLRGYNHLIYSSSQEVEETDNNAAANSLLVSWSLHHGPRCTLQGTQNLSCTAWSQSNNNMPTFSYECDLENKWNEIERFCNAVLPTIWQNSKNIKNHKG